MFREKVQSLLESFLEERTDLFLIDFKLSNDNKINIILDGDKGVSIQDCLDVSRAIENNIDREEIDFALEVASFGLSNSLSIPRQFIKNVGRELDVIDSFDKSFTAELINANQESIILKWNERVPKKIGKGKETIQIEKEFLYKDVKSAKIHINFN